MYAKRTLGEWSSTVYGAYSSGIYYLTSCEDSTLKKCSSQQQIRTKTATTTGDYSVWSRSYNSLSDMNLDTSTYAYQYRYNNGTNVTESEKGGSTKGIGYKYYISTGTTKNQLTDIAESATKAYTESSRMTVAEISSFTTQIGNDAVNAYNVTNALQSSTNDYVTWEKYTSDIEGQLTNYQVGSAAASKFTNEARFIPYIFITRHYRATSKQFLIEGYSDTNYTTTIIDYKKSVEDTKSVTMTPDYVKCCDIYPSSSVCDTDICHTYPDSDECYCKTHELEYPRCANYCDDPNHKTELVCKCVDEPDLCKTVTDPTTNSDTAVIYYDYNDPLVNYTQYTIPSNWSGYASLVNEIKNSNLSGYKIQVTLTKSDLEDMRDWVQNNPDKVGTGAMIKAFSHIFTSNDDAVNQFLTD